MQRTYNRSFKLELQDLSLDLYWFPLYVVLIGFEEPWFVVVNQLIWINTDPRSVFTVNQDGTVIVHTVRRGQFLRTLHPPSSSCVPAHISELQVGSEGHIVVQTTPEESSHKKVHAHTSSTVQFKHKHADTKNKFLRLLMSLSAIYLVPQGKYSIHVYSVNGCLLASLDMEEQVTALHLVSDYVILGTMQGSLHIMDLYR